MYLPGYGANTRVRPYTVRDMTRDAAQQRNWTFYEAVKKYPPHSGLMFAKKGDNALQRVKAMKS